MTVGLDLAQKIQRALIPQKFPARGPLDISGAYLPMEELGGDFYDIYEAVPGIWTVIMADVSGHGIPAALVTAMVKISLGVHRSREKTPGQVLTEVNRELWAAIGDIRRHVTIVLCSIDLEAGTLAYCNGGHNEFLVVRNTGPVEIYGPNSGVVGLHADELFLTRTISFGPGDGVFLFTDGLVDAKGKDRGTFNLDRLAALVLAHHEAGSEGLVDQIEGEVRAFTGDLPQQDDIAFLSVRRPVQRTANQEPAPEKMLSALVPEEPQTKAEAYYQAREFQELLVWAENAVNNSTLNMEKSRILHWKAMALTQLEKYDQALEAWDQALALNSEHHRARRNRDFLAAHLSDGISHG